MLVLKGYIYCIFYSSITWYDSGCNSKRAVGLAADIYMANLVDVFIGPPCSEGTASYNIIIMKANISKLNYKKESKDVHHNHSTQIIHVQLTGFGLSGTRQLIPPGRAPRGPQVPHMIGWQAARELP